ncbi:hypothetical protein ADILRU_1456 [Leifsonia rubra CMS 76R]|nr:hypothetical protein ADILRU_1456 [Leifsonia rubra CMS 76R]
MLSLLWLLSDSDAVADTPSTVVEVMSVGDEQPQQRWKTDFVKSILWA